MKIGVLLTQWKRNNLEYQLQSLYSQTLVPHYIVVFQNENHVNILPLKEKYNFIHVKSDYNTKYFGRFAYFMSLPVDICMVMDDDIVPGINCVKNYVEQCLRKNAIIGGNGRIGLLSDKYTGTGPHFENCDRFTSSLTHPKDVGAREGTKVDFVGHLWCFKKDWLYYMFGTKPFTYDTGEDMHLCFSCKVFGGIDSYVGEQKTNDDMCDIAFNQLAADEHASFRTTKMSLRKAVEQYWIDKGLKYITDN